MASTVGFHTLGCKLNFSETATVARQFDSHGFEVVNFDDFADVYVINTCSVTENADRKCKKIVKKALKINPDAFIIVMGCYAQLKPQDIAEIYGVDAVVGASEKFRIFEILGDFNKKQLTGIHRCQIQEATEFVPSHTLENRTRAFLKIQDGCDYKCSFCTIPLARGMSRSDTLENILTEALKLEEANVREIVLTGVNIGDYGKNSSDNFYDLIQLLDKRLTVPRIRISSIEPNLLNDEIIDFVSTSKRFMPHFHIPLQSGSDKILRLMRRRYLSDLYFSRVEKIRSVMPHAAIGCDVIVGFPGEEKEDFRVTMDFIQSMDITYLHVFPFSERNNTLAASMDGTVSMGERYERGETLRTISDEKKNTFYKKHIGSIQNVLLENEFLEDHILGFTENYIRVAIPCSEFGESNFENKVNKELQIKLLENMPSGVVRAKLI